MKELDELIPGTNMTYQERIELAVGDGRGKYTITEELNGVRGAVEYARQRIEFWTIWNNAYRHTHIDMNTQDRFIAAQQASKVYASAVQKSLITLISGEILQRGIRDLSQCLYELKELFWLFTGGSLLIMRDPCFAVLCIARSIKSYNYNVGFQLEAKFANASVESVRNWIRLKKQL